MNSEELAANLFRATQAEAKLKRENISGQNKANQAHLDVGKKVRQTIKELGGTLPENLPTPDNIKESKKRLNPNFALDTKQRLYSQHKMMPAKGGFNPDKRDESGIWGRVT